MSNQVGGIGQVPTVTVKKGETLSQIAEDHNMKLSELLSANPGVEADKIKAGQKLNLQNPVIEQSRAAINKAIEYGYGEDYEFSIAQNGDIILKMKNDGKKLGEIRRDFRIEAGSLSRTNDVKGRFKPKYTYDIDQYKGYNDYDQAKTKKGDVIVVERLQFKPDENKSAWDRFWANF